MKLSRTFRIAFAWLALLLPLQGYAATPCEHHDPSSSAAGMAADAGAHPHCDSGSAPSHHHGCGNCCCGAAVALPSVDGIAALSAAREFSDTLRWSHPGIMLDRLDRPPR